MFFHFINVFLTLFLVKYNNYKNGNVLISRQKNYALLKETIINNKKIIYNQGSDNRKNNTITNLDILENDKILLTIAKNFEKKVLLDYLQNKDISIISKLDAIEKNSEILSDSKSKYTYNLCLQKEIDEFLSL